MPPNNNHGGDMGDIEMLFFVFGGFALLVAIWYFSGGAEKADLRGIFLNAPPPLDSGDAYGPTFNSSSTQP